MSQQSGAAAVVYYAGYHYTVNPSYSDAVTHAIQMMVTIVNNTELASPHVVEYIIGSYNIRHRRDCTAYFPDVTPRVGLMYMYNDSCLTASVMRAAILMAYSYQTTTWCDTVTSLRL